MSEETAKEVAPREPRKRRRFLKVLAALAVLVALIVLFLPYLMPTEWIASAAEKGLRSAFGRPTRLGKVSWGWLSGVRVEEVVVEEGEEYGGGEFLRMRALSLRVSLWEFLTSIGKSVTVSSIVMESPHILIVRTADGRFNFENIAWAPRARGGARVARASLIPSSAGDIEIAVNRIKIKDGTVTFKDLATGITVEASDVEALINADFSGARAVGSADVSLAVRQPAGDGELAVSLKRFSVDKEPSRKALETLEAEGTVAVDGLELPLLAAAAAPTADVRLASGTASARMSYKVASGRVELAASSGRVDNLVLALRAPEKRETSIGDVTFSFDASGEVGDAGRSLAVKNLKAATPFAEIGLSGRITEEANRFNVALKGSGDVDPGLIPPGLLQLPEGTEASGRVPFELEYEGDPLPREVYLSADATAADVKAGSFRKKSATAAALTARVLLNRQLREATIEGLTVKLEGGTVSGEATVGLEARSARWKGRVAFDGVNTADYADVPENVLMRGGITHEGEVVLAEPKRTSALLLDTTFEDFAVDLTSRPGEEVVLSGRAEANSARATARDFILTLGGSPLTINALITEPLAKPAGNIVIRGKKADAEELGALLGAFAEAVPEESETAEPAPAEEGEESEALADRARRLADRYLRKANIDVDVRIDEVTHEEFTGRSFLVDGRLLGGTFALRKASVGIFAGLVSIDGAVSLSDPLKPCRLNVVVSALQANDPAKRFLSEVAYWLDFSGRFDLSFAAEGNLGGGEDDIARSFSGTGSFDVTNGVLSITDLPDWAALLVPGGELSGEAFSKLHGELVLADGLLKSESRIPRGDVVIFIDGETSYTGENTHTIGVIPVGTGTKVRFLTVRDGHLEPAPLGQDLINAGLAGLLKKQAESGEEDEGEAETSEEKTEEALKSVLDELLKKVEEEVKKD
ncbi:MAG: DUF748 domain-containing protein [Planctomycetota bacterium]|jgi:uncharacterized protein involved in outer membrane biogenesis